VSEKVAYDEFGLFHENAAEFGLSFDEPPAVRRAFVEVRDGRSLSALVWGSGDPEIALLHGGGQNAHTWDTVALALRPRSLVAIDLPGHGHSDGPDPEQLRDPWSFVTATDVAAVIAELAPRARGVVGMSAGGLTAIRIAAIAPQLVRRLVLVDVLPGLDQARAHHILDFLSGPATFPNLDELLARTKEFNPTRSESSLRRGILHNAMQLDDGTWVWRHQRWRLGSPPAVAPSPGAPSSEPGTTASDDWDLLMAIDVPILLCRGLRADSVLRDADEAALVGARPDVTVHHFAGAGHSIQGDMPVALAAAIDEFVA
jgi:pimeloyl-ACP methyl ester carboxylesterase